MAAINLRRGKIPERLVVLASMFGVLLASCQVLFFGRALFPYHYYLIAGLPLSGIIIFDFVDGYLILWSAREYDKTPKYTQLASGLVIVLTFLWAGYYVFNFSKRNVTSYSLPSAVVDAFDFLNNSTPPGSVVGSFSMETNTLLSVHTHNSVFIPNACPMCTIATDDEIIDRFSVMANMKGVPESWLGAPFEQSRWLFFVFPEKGRPEFEQQVWGFALFFYRFMFQPEQPAPSLFMDSIRTRFEWWQVQPRPKLLEAYCLNYIWVDNYERSVGAIDMSQDPEFKLIFNKDDVSIYQLVHPKCEK